MMSEKPENRMPLSHPARSVDAAPPDLPFERAFGGRVEPVSRRPWREVFDADADVEPFAGLVPRTGLACSAGGVAPVAGFDPAPFAAGPLAATPFAAAPLAAAPLAAAPLAASALDAFDETPFAAEPFEADVAAASALDVPGTAGHAGRARGARSIGLHRASSPTREGERGRPHGRPRHEIRAVRP
jgi:hypothetical protein